jgi:hypothetical protein
MAAWPPRGWRSPSPPPCGAMARARPRRCSARTTTRSTPLRRWCGTRASTAPSSGRGGGTAAAPARRLGQQAPAVLLPRHAGQPAAVRRPGAVLRLPAGLRPQERAHPAPRHGRGVPAARRGPRRLLLGRTCRHVTGPDGARRGARRGVLLRRLQRARRPDGHAHGQGARPDPRRRGGGQPVARPEVPGPSRDTSARPGSCRRPAPGSSSSTASADAPRGGGKRW